MRIRIITVLSIVFAALLISQSFACDLNIFSDPDASDISTTPGSQRIIRQRTASLTVGIWELENSTRLCMNLFNDVQLIANMMNIQFPSAGGISKIGKVTGIDDSQITLAIVDNVVSVTIQMNSLIYKVRPLHENQYIIREIMNENITAKQDTTLSKSATSQLTAVSVELEVLNLTNQEREENGLHALSWNNKLFEAARSHSEDMADQDYFSHSSLDGRTPFDRINDAGYNYNSAAENIAAGYNTPQLVMEGWMASPGHQANILRDSICDIGVGYATGSQSSYSNYWTQNFGRQQGVSVCPEITEPDVPDDPDPDPGSDPSPDSGGGGGGCFIEFLLN